MKKYIIYLIILISGLLLGWLLFGDSTQKVANENHDKQATKNEMWTCSMHPQIMQPEAGDCPICGMDLIPAEAGADGLTPNQFKLTENAIALANIQTTIVSKGNIQGNSIKLTGKIAENEESNAVQISFFSGRIERLYINFTGEEVQKGQPLATIYSPELYAAQQELITTASLKETQPALYKAVRNKLKLWKLSEKQINQIESSSKILENFTVYATVSGTVTEKLVNQGDYIKQGQPILKIANLNTVWANFDVYENQIELFEKGQEVTISTNAYPNKTFNGKVDFIDPILNTKTRTLDLRVVLNNRNDIFKPGMFVTAEINSKLNTKESVLTIPASSVLWTGERSVVYLKTNPNEPVFEMREVSLGNRIGNSYEILEGLFEGNEIVTNGTFTVDAAAQLQGKKSMMNKNGESVMTGHESHLGMDKNISKKESDNTNENERLIVSDKFQEQLKIVYNDYIKLKNALVENDADKSSKLASNLVSNLSKVDMKLLNEDAHNIWMSFSEEIKTSAGAIATTKNINNQRNKFKDLSSYLIKTVQAFGINKKVYVEFCPMADNDKGAYWLSNEDQIRNPYFGDAMLKCGEVKQIIE